jgi:hypothetical protein
LDGPGLLEPSIELVRRASALGLLAGLPPIERLDLDVVQAIARAASSAGVGQDAALALAREQRPEQLAPLIRRLDEALAESPVPDRELRELLRTFDAETLSRILGTSAMSVRRYERGDRRPSDRVAGRVHWLALVVSDLAGAYNAFGIRRWFERGRAQLDGRSPREVLGTDWDPAGSDAELVRTLAAALAGAGAAT